MAISYKSSLIFVLFISQLHCGKVKIKSHAPDRRPTDLQDLFYTEYIITHDLPEIAPTDPSYIEPEVEHRFKKVVGFACIFKAKLNTLNLVNVKDNFMDPYFYVALNSGTYERTKEYEKDITVNGSKLCVAWGTWVPLSFNTDEKGRAYFNFFTNINIFQLPIFFFFNSDTYIKGSHLTLKLVSFKENSVNLNEEIHSEIQKLNCLDESKPNGSTIDGQTFENEFKFGDTAFTFKGDGEFQIYIEAKSNERANAIAAITQVALNNKITNESDKKKIDWSNLVCTNTSYELIRGPLSPQFLI